MANGDSTRLEYLIEISVKNQEAVKQLQDSIKSLSSDFGNLAEALRATAQAQFAASKAQVEASKSSRKRIATVKEETDALDAQAVARERINKAEFEADVAQARAVADRKDRFKLARREISQTRAREIAITNIAKAADKRLISEKALIEIEKRGITFSRKELQQIGVQDQATLSLAEANDRLALAKINAREDIQKIKAETKALEAQNKVRQEAADRIAFGTLGLQTPTQKKEQEQALEEARKVQERIFRKTFGEEVSGQRQLIDIQKQRAQIERDSNNQTLIQRRAALAVEQEIAANKQAQATQDARIRAGLVRAGEDPVKKNKEFNKSLKTTQSLANRISFTFRRLFGILAAFTIARRAIQAFTESIRSAIRFNAALEQTRLGIASIFLATGQVTDALGNSLKGSQGLAIAQKEAKKQTELLKIEAVRTAATFEELAEAFQTAIAPGLRAGLDLGAIRELTVRISQAAAAIGVPQRQLAEEIRSLLQGTIRVRDTRIAVALGITNEDIRRAKELGQLGKFLQERFTAFGEAGAEAEKTFNVALSNLKDALLQLSGEAGLGFFEELKALIIDIKDSIVTVKRDLNEIEFNPDAVAAAQIFFDILKNAVQESRLLGQNLETAQIQNLGTAVASAASIAFSSIRIAIDILIEGLALAGTILQNIFNLFANIGDIIKDTFLGPVVNGLEIFIKRVFTLSIALKGVILTFTLLFKLLVQLNAFLIAPFVKGAVALFKFAAGTAKLSFTLAFLRAGLIALLIPLSKIATALFLGAVAGFTIAAAFKALNTEVSGSQKLVNNLRILERELNRLEKVSRGIAIAPNLEDRLRFGKLEEFPKTAEEVREEIRKIQKELDQLGIDPETFIGDPNLKQRFVKEFDNILTEVGDLISGLFERTTKTALEGASPLARAFEQSTAAITAGNFELEEQQKTLLDLKDAAREAQEIFKLTADTLDVSTAVIQQRLEFIQAELDIEKETKQIRADTRVQEGRLTELYTRQIVAKEKIRALTLREQVAVQAIKEDITNVENLRRKEAELQTKSTLLSLELKRAKELGKQGEIDRLQRELQFIEDQISDTQERINKQKRITESTINEFLKDQEVDREKLVDLAQEELQLKAEEEGTLKAIKFLQEQILGLENARFKIARIRAQEIALTETRASVLQTRELQTQIEAEQRLLAARQRFSLQPRKEALAIARNELNTEKEKLKTIKEQGEATLRQLDLQIKENLLHPSVLSFVFQRLAKEKEINSEIQLQLLRIGLIKQELQEIQLQEQRPIFAGLLEFADEFSTTALDKFTNTVNLMQSIFQGFTDTLATNIAAAFDPTATSQDNKERWGRFFLSLATQAIAMLIQIALAQAILVPWLNFVTPSGSSAAHLAKFSKFEEGGEIPKRSKNTPASPAHFSKKARAFSIGGAPNSRDTTPIWAQPGEWMMRVAAVKKYGLGVMSAINEGLLDPTALKSLAGTRRFSSAIRSHKIPAFQTGGFIGDRLNQLAQQGPPVEIRQSNKPNIGFIISNEDQMDKLLAQGEPGLLRFIEKNASIIRNFLI